MVSETTCPTCGSVLLYDPDDGGMPPEDETNEQFDLVADNVWQWLCCPCDRHMFYIGLAVDAVAGFAPRLVIETATRMIRDELADDERELPEGVDVLALNTLQSTLFPPDDNAVQAG
jgi:hypothetical protein